MAIYKNREVSVQPTSTASAPKTAVVQYQDGSYETVTLGQIKFTKAEKDALVKNYPSEYDGVDVVDDNDLTAVRAGVAPSSDPVFKQQAEEQAKRKQAEDISRKQADEAQKQANKTQPQSGKDSVK